MKRIIPLIVCVFSVLCANSFAFAALESKAIVLAASGRVKVMSSAGGVSSACKEGMSLRKGTRITTEEGSYAILAFNMAASNIIKIRKNSDVILKLTSSETIELIDGEVFLVLKGLELGEKFKVRTSAALCSAVGTGANLKMATPVNVPRGQMTAIDVYVYEGKFLVRPVGSNGSPLGAGNVVPANFAGEATQGNTEMVITGMTSLDLSSYKSEAEALLRKYKKPEEP